MTTWILMLELCAGYSAVSCHFPILPEKYLTLEVCERIAEEAKSTLGAQYNKHYCIKVRP